MIDYRPGQVGQILRRKVKRTGLESLRKKGCLVGAPHTDEDSSLLYISVPLKSV